jgi:hypothetical protein
MVISADRSLEPATIAASMAIDRLGAIDAALGSGGRQGADLFVARGMPAQPAGEEVGDRRCGKAIEANPPPSRFLGAKIRRLLRRLGDKLQTVLP